MTTSFFQKPTALNRERHRNTKLDTSLGNLEFAAGTSSMMVAAAEMDEAALSYPIVFVGADKPTSLLALLGLNQDENLFVDGGKWDAESYIPAFVRRYPFVLAEGGPEDKLTVCVDEAHPGLNEERGEALVQEDGEPTPYLQGAIDFLGHCHAEMQRTAMFVQRMNELGLLIERNIEVSRGGATYRLEGFHIVDREKLEAVDDTVALELVRTGAMRLIEAHLLSLRNVERMAVRQDRRRQAQAPVAAA